MHSQDKTKMKQDILLQLLQTKDGFLLVPRQALNFGRSLHTQEKKERKIELNSREIMQRTNKSSRISTEESMKKQMKS